MHRRRHELPPGMAGMAGGARQFAIGHRLLAAHHILFPHERGPAGLLADLDRLSAVVFRLWLYGFCCSFPYLYPVPCALERKCIDRCAILWYLPVPQVSESLAATTDGRYRPGERRKFPGTDLRGGVSRRRACVEHRCGISVPEVA